MRADPGPRPSSSKGLHVFVGNITMFGPKFKHYLETKREHYGAFLVAETHVIQSKADGVNIGMKKAGWICYMSHSQQVLDESKKGPNHHGEGGTMAGALAHMQSSTVSEWHAGYMIEDFAPMILNIKGCSVCMIAAYLRPGIGMSGRNASRMQMMAACVSMIRMPWAIYADWNVEQLTWRRVAGSQSWLGDSFGQKVCSLPASWEARD